MHKGHDAFKKGEEQKTSNIPSSNTQQHNNTPFVLYGSYSDAFAVLAVVYIFRKAHFHPTVGYIIVKE